MDCPVPHDVAAIEARLDDAEQAYAALDVDRFTARADALVLDLQCLAEPIPPAVAGRVHRVRALLQWGDGREDDARRSLAALRRIHAADALPAELVPQGHALHQALADAGDPRFVPVAEPVAGTLAFDGTPSLERPAGQPSIVQLLAPESVAWTA